MKEKLLALLVAKFVGVDNAILEKIAEKKAAGITDEGQLQTIVDGVDFGTILQSEADRRATEASQTARQNAISEYEKKHNLKDGKVIETPTPPPAPPAPKEGETELEKLVRTQAEQINQLTGLVKGVVENQTTSQKQASAKVLFDEAELPEKWFDSRIDVNSETSVKDQITALKTEYDEIRQGVINKSVENGLTIPKSSLPAETDAEGYKKLMGVDNSIPGVKKAELDLPD